MEVAPADARERGAVLVDRDRMPRVGDIVVERLVLKAHAPEPDGERAPGPFRVGLRRELDLLDDIPGEHDQKDYGEHCEEPRPPPGRRKVNECGRARKRV